MKASSEARLAVFLERTGAGTWEWNFDSGELIVNQRWAEMLGYGLSDLQPVSIKTWESLVHPDDKDLALLNVTRVLNHQSDSYDYVLRMRHKDGNWRFIRARGVLVQASDSSDRWIVGTHLDITDYKQTQHQLTQLAESLPGIIYSFVMEPDGTYYFPYLSRKTEDFYGFSPEIGIRYPDRMFDLVHPDDLANVKDTIARSYESLCEWECEYRVQVKGNFRWMRGIALPERESDGTVKWHGMVINIDDQKELEAELERLSVTDELTGIFNRRYMFKELESQLATNERYAQPFSLVSIDIDHFKTVNDTFGHLVGDEVLRSLAGIISKRIRKTDIFARTGGEEFMILMPHTDLNEANTLAEGLRKTLQAHTFKAEGDQTLKVTISAGIVGYSGRRKIDAVELLRICDQCLYRAKGSGRNCLILLKL